MLSMDDRPKARGDGFTRQAAKAWIWRRADGDWELVAGDKVGPVRDYVLELTYVPDGVEGAPAVGTTWQLDLTTQWDLKLPTYNTEDGTESYAFSFTVLAVPEPVSILAWTAAVLLLLRRRYMHRVTVGEPA